MSLCVHTARQLAARCVGTPLCWRVSKASAQVGAYETSSAEATLPGCLVSYRPLALNHGYARLHDGF